MLKVRHLHSHNLRKEKQLQVCDIIATLDFNGLKFSNAGNKRKGESCLIVHEAGEDDFSKKIRLNDVAARFHTNGSAKKSDNVNLKASKEPKKFCNRSICTVDCETNNFTIGCSINDHSCMSYSTFKEKYEMSPTNIIKFTEKLNRTGQERNTGKGTPQPTYANRSSSVCDSTPLLGKLSSKPHHAKGNRLATKFSSEKNSIISAPKPNSNKNNYIRSIEKQKGKLKKKCTIKGKSLLNVDGKKSKCTKSTEKEENSSGTVIDNDCRSLAKQNVMGTPNCDEKKVLEGSDMNGNGIVAKSTPAFACNICTDSFVSQNTLDIHLKYDHRPRPTCSQCHKMFDCRRKLINHEANCSSSESRVVATATQSLGGIIDFISPVEVFFCVKCENPFPSKNILREHKILLNKRKPIALELSEETPSPNYHKDELYEICVKKIPSFSAPPLFENDYNKCGYCGKSFQNLRRFQQHSVFCYKMKMVLSQRECVYCKKTFRSAEIRDRHTCYCSKRTHGTSLLINDDDYSCKLCNVVMRCLMDYNLHLHINHDQRYCCKCNQMYSPDTVQGLKHECDITNILLGGYVEVSKDDCDKNEKMTNRRISRKKRRIDNFMEDHLVLNNSISGNDSLNEDNVTPVHKNIPVERNKLHSSIKSKYERRSPRVIHVNKLHLSPERNSNLTYHCIFCPEHSFTHRTGLDAHLKNRHNKEQCKFCGDIFGCNARFNHDCLYNDQSKVANNNSLEIDGHNSQNGGSTPVTPTTELNPAEIIEVVESDSSEEKPLDESSKSAFRYKCYKCSKTFSQKHFMIKHLVVHSKRHPYKCKYCRKLFKLPKHIHDHIKNIHYPRTFNHRKPLIQSLTERHQIKKCHLCMNFFLGITDLKLHQKEFHGGTNTISNGELSMCITSTPIPSCQICHKTDISLKLDGKSKRREQICKDCSDAMNRDCFQNFQDVYSNVGDESVKCNVDRELRCSYCFKTFSSKKSFDQHDDMCFVKKQAFSEADLIKPLVPTTESCYFEFTFSDEQNEGDVMTLEEARATLQSLDVNYGLSNEVMSQSSIEVHTTSGDSPVPVTAKEQLAFIPCSSASLSTVPSLHQSVENAKETIKICQSRNLPNVLKFVDCGNPSSVEEKFLNNKENSESSVDDIRILNSYQVFPCRECNVNFDSKSSLDYHVKGFHRKTEKEIKLAIPLHVNMNQSTYRKTFLADKDIEKSNFECLTEKNETKVTPSPNGDRAFDATNSQVSAEKLIKESACPLNCRVDFPGHSHPYGNCTIIDSIRSCPVHKDNDSMTALKAVPPRRSCRNFEKGAFVDKRQCKNGGKDACGCCNLRFFNSPRFTNPHQPNQKKYVFYPGEYPTALLRKYLPCPPSYVTYTPKVSDEVVNTYQTLDLFRTPYQPSTVHHRPPYLFDELSHYREKNVNESRFFHPFNGPRFSRNKRRRPNVEVGEDKKISSSLSSISPPSPPSPTCDVNVVVDILKPLSPKSLDKSLQNESRPKYTKSEVVVKMTRLADTLGRKFGTGFKRNAFDIAQTN